MWGYLPARALLELGIGWRGSLVPKNRKRTVLYERTTPCQDLSGFRFCRFRRNLSFSNLLVHRVSFSNFLVHALTLLAWVRSFSSATSPPAEKDGRGLRRVRPSQSYVRPAPSGRFPPIPG